MAKPDEFYFVCHKILTIDTLF